MPKLPARSLRNKDFVWLAEHTCKAHRVNYLTHYNCYLKEQPSTAPMYEKIGVFDIETTGLKANWSHMLAWCIKEHGKKTIHSDLITRKEVRDKNDRRIITSAIKELRKYDRIVTYYGSRFDIPYTRSRALHQKISFPLFRELYHTDMYYIARNKFAIHSNRLASICQFFNIEAKNHPMTPELWQKAGAGKAAALKTILTHCKEDVVSTDEVFDMLFPHMQINKRSI